MNLWWLVFWRTRDAAGRNPLRNKKMPAVKSLTASTRSRQLTQPFSNLKSPLGPGRVPINQISVFGIKASCRWWSLSLWIRSSWRLRLPLPDVICQLLLFPPPDTRQDFLYKRYNFSSFQAKVFIYLGGSSRFFRWKISKCSGYICHTSRTL